MRRKVLRQLHDGVRHSLIDVLGLSSVGEVEEHDVAAGALDQGADRGPVALTDDQVAFPVAGNGPVFGLRWTLGDHDHARDLSPSLDPAARSALRPTGAQATGKLPSQLRHGPRTNSDMIDRLVAHPHHRIVRELHPQAGARSPPATTTPPATRPPGRPADHRPASASWPAGPAQRPAGAPGGLDSRLVRRCALTSRDTVDTARPTH